VHLVSFRTSSKNKSTIRSSKPPVIYSILQFSQFYILGIIAGAVGAFVGTPADLSLIRMTADGRYG
jgi:hypothetical protein